MKSLKSQLRKYKRLVIVLSIVLVVLSILLINTRNRRDETLDLTIESVQNRNVEKKVTADGYIQGQDSRVVFFTPGLKVTEVRFNVGDQVNQDDVLAVLTTNDGRNNTTEVKSPISGIITEYNYKQNDIVGSVNSAGVKVVDTSTYKIELLVNENDIIDLKAGQPAKIIYSAISIEEEFNGEVDRVFPDAVAESAAVSYRVIVKPSEYPEQLKLGMSVGVEITTARAENVLSIPESFLVEKEDKIYLKFLMWDNEEKTSYQINEKEVTIGLRTDEYVELKSGVKEGDEIVEPNFVPARLGLFGN